MEFTAGESNSKTVSNPNVVPLIDVLLVLIIIFMVITPTVPAGLPAVVPKPSPPASKSDPATVVVQIMQNGKLMINQNAVEWSALGARLLEIFKDRADKAAFIESANEVPFAEVARAIDIMRSAGIDHVGLIPAGANSQE